MLKPSPMPSINSRPAGPLLWLSLLAASMLLSACAAAPKPGPLSTVQCPRPAKLSESVLQAMQPDSTQLLQTAESWLSSSGRLLSTETSGLNSSEP